MGAIVGLFDRKYLLSIVAMLLILPAFNCTAQKSMDPVDIYVELGNKYFDAMDYLDRNTWIYDTLVRENISPEFAYSIVFPNLAKYSGLRDVVETGGLKTLYVQSGRKYSKYSVGRFQMKPSWAELVERNAVRYKLTEYKFKMTNNPKARSERAKRLDATEWQVRYLVLYIKVMDKRFAHIKWKNEVDKVRFYSTAFNVGFNKNERTIRFMMSRKTLHSTSKYNRSRYRSGDIAAWFFENDGHRYKSQIPILPKVENKEKN